MQLSIKVRCLQLQFYCSLIGVAQGQPPTQNHTESTGSAGLCTWWQTELQPGSFCGSGVKIRLYRCGGNSKGRPKMYILRYKLALYNGFGGEIRLYLHVNGGISPGRQTVYIL